MANLKLGLDKITINNIRVTLADPNQLSKQDNVQYSHDGTSFPLQDVEDDFFNIDIRDNFHFEDFRIYDLSMKGGSTTATAVLTMDVTKLMGNNLYPLTVNEYMEYMDMIGTYLWDRYGLDVDFSYATYKYAEITALIELSNTFENFSRILRMFWSFPNKHMGDIRNNAEVNNLQNSYKNKGWTRGNKEWSLIVYDKKATLDDAAKKSSDLKQCIKDLDPSKAYIHLEAKLATPNKIETVFGTRDVHKITDADIQDAFWHICEKYLVKPFRVMENHHRNELKRLMEQAKATSPTHWSDILLDRCLECESAESTPLLIDAEVICKMIMEREDPHRNRSSQAKKFRQRCERKDCLKVYAHHDQQKAEEFIQKLYDVSHPIC